MSGVRRSCKIIITSDIHGYLYPTDYRSFTEQNFGLAKIASLIQRERKESKAGEETLLIDNGDLIQGSPLAAYYARHERGMHPAIRILNELAYDAAVLGNHEFNYGQPMLHQVVKTSRFPWLAANIIDCKTGEPAFGPPYIIKRLGNRVGEVNHDFIRVAILGVTTHYIPHWEHPAHLEGLVFMDALETVKKWVSFIRQQESPDLLVVAYHGGFERDPVSGELTGVDTGENQGYEICQKVQGIDVLITGHQHNMLAGQLNGVSYVQPGYQGQVLGKVTITWEKQQGKWRLIDKSEQLLCVDDAVPVEKSVLVAIAELEAKTQSWLDRPIGRVIGDMSINNPIACRLADHPFMEWVQKVQMEAASASISCAALLSNDASGFKDMITMRDVQSHFMYPNTLTVLRLKGSDIRAALEQTARYFTLDAAGRPVVDRAYLEPKPQHYNYDMWEGIDYELDIAKPVGERLVFLNDANGVPLDDEGEYEVVMNNYRASGGGDYEMFKGRPIVREIVREMAELAVDYIQERGEIEASCNRNWRVCVNGRPAHELL